MTNAIRFTATFALALAACAEPRVNSLAEDLGRDPPQIISASISAGDNHTCSLTREGRVYCWGQNTSGQVGANQSESLVRSPRLVSGLPTGATAITLGGNHSCALLGNSQVWCWGENSDGQLGNGSAQDSSIPVRVASVGAATSLAAGANFTCAVSSGVARCWGSNRTRVIGPPLNPNQNIMNPRPRVIPGVPTGLVSVAAGLDHACVLTRTGEVWCWGDGSHGEVGVAGRNLAPQRVTGVPAASSIAAGEDRSCAATASGDVWCWGSTGHRLFYQSEFCPPWANASPNVGLDLANQIPAARLVSVGEPIRSMDLGQNHGCLATATRTMCWGYDEDGQLGQGVELRRQETFNGYTSAGIWEIRMGNRFELRNVRGLDASLAVTAGKTHSCAVSPNGTASCWGNNRFAQLGFGDGAITATSDERSVTTPVEVNGLHNVRDLISSNRDIGFCALNGDGRVLCWGNADPRTLGLVPRWDSVPTPIPQLGHSNIAIRFSTDTPERERLCAQGSSGQWRCIRTNVEPSNNDAHDADFSNHAASATRDCTIRSGSIHCDFGPAVNLPEPAVAISAGGPLTCARTSTGRVFCTHGPPGFWTEEQGIAGARSVATGSLGGCAIESSRDVRCFIGTRFRPASDPERLALGIAAPVESNGPVLRRAARSQTMSQRALSISIGFETACFVDEDGRVFCSGDNTFGVSGNGSSAPIQVANLLPAALPEPTRKVVAGNNTNSVCALSTSGNVYCWGDRRWGALGIGYPIVTRPQTTALTSANPDAACTGSCDANEICIEDSGQCACAPGYHRCGGACVSSFDVSSCGQSCSPCAGEGQAAFSCDGARCHVVACELGSRLASDGQSCVQQSSCTSNNGGCANEAQCIDSPSGPLCVCPPDRPGDGTSCANQGSNHWVATIVNTTEPFPNDPSTYVTRPLVAVSADGLTAALANPRYSDDRRASEGRIVIYVQRAGAWVFEAALSADADLPFNALSFGNSMALSHNGDVLAVAQFGVVLTYRRDNGVWSEPVPARNLGAPFTNWSTASVALSDDGRILVMGSPNWADGAPTRSHVDVMGLASASGPHPFGWQLLYRIDGPAYSLGGSSNPSHAQVSCSADCSIIAATNPQEDGTVYLYSRLQDSATLLGTILPVPNSGFGRAIALSRDGRRLLVGAPLDTTQAPGGAVYVYDVNGTSSATARLVAQNNGPGDLFGSSVAWSPDGLSIVVGAPHEDSTALGLDDLVDEQRSNSGAAYLYRASINGTWVLQRRLKPLHSLTWRLEHTSPLAFGGSVVFAGSANHLLIPALNSYSAGRAELYQFFNR